MEDSIIFALLNTKHLNNYREELLKEESNFTKWINKSREDFEKTTDKEQLELVNRHIYDIRLHEEYIDYLIGIRILNYGIKIGMELNKAFSDIDNK